MAVKDLPVVDMRWLANGEEDPHERYITLAREDLAGAFISDDELANRASFLSTISQEKDTADMIHSHRTGGDYICKSVVGEIIKERLRWMSRRIAILEGRYPGLDNTVPVLPKVVEVDQQDAKALERLEEHLPRLRDALYLPDTFSASWLKEFLVDRRMSNHYKNLTSILGMNPAVGPTKRWHLYTTYVSSLLRYHGIYVPFDDDQATIDLKRKIVVFNKSKYFSSGKEYTLHQAPVAKLFPEGNLIDKLNFHFNRHNAILDIWLRGDDTWGANWLDGSYKLIDLLNQLFEEIVTTDPEIIIKGDFNDQLTNVMGLLVDAWLTVKATQVDKNDPVERERGATAVTHLLITKE